MQANRAAASRSHFRSVPACRLSSGLGPEVPPKPPVQLYCESCGLEVFVSLLSLGCLLVYLRLRCC